MTFLERWYEEVWNKGRESAIDEMVEPNVIAHGLTPDGSPVIGAELFKSFFRTFQSTLSGVHVRVEDTVTQGDLTVARFFVTAKHTGDALGIPPKGNAIHFTGVSIVRLKDDRIAEAWNYLDFPKMYKQME
jgi:predicted ester cyclase